MDNQHPLPEGYARLDGDGETTALLNEIKARGLELQALVDKVSVRLHAQHQAYGPDPLEPQPVVGQLVELRDPDQMQRMQEAEPDKWLLEAQLTLQKGLMFLTRAVEQPSGF